MVLWVIFKKGLLLVLGYLLVIGAKMCSVVHIIWPRYCRLLKGLDLLISKALDKLHFRVDKKVNLHCYFYISDILCTFKIVFVFIILSDWFFFWLIVNEQNNLC